MIFPETQRQFHGIKVLAIERKQDMTIVYSMACYIYSSGFSIGNSIQLNNTNHAAQSRENKKPKITEQLVGEIAWTATSIICNHFNGLKTLTKLTRMMGLLENKTTSYLK